MKINNRRYSYFAWVYTLNTYSVIRKTKHISFIMPSVLYYRTPRFYSIIPHPCSPFSVKNHIRCTPKSFANISAEYTAVILFLHAPQQNCADGKTCKQNSDPPSRRGQRAHRRGRKAGQSKQGQHAAHTARISFCVSFGHIRIMITVQQLYLSEVTNQNGSYQQE